MGVHLKQSGSLAWLAAENISAPHGFTTRLGGVSQGTLASLNIGTHRGDDPANVEENFARLGEAIGFDPRKAVLTRQTHTDIILQADETLWGAGLYAPENPECDGLITNTPGTALVIFTADCTPILLHDPVTGAVGAVHAGWRGTVQNIGGKAVRAMEKAYGCRPENIRAAIGPNIAQCCFETDSDVPRAVLQAFGKETEPYISQKGEKYYVNLKAVNALALRRAGVSQIEISQLCTACRTDLFWSHRRHGSGRGSQGAVILCKEAGI